MSTYNRINWDQSIIEVGKRFCPECNAEMKYLGINLNPRLYLHLWECPVDSFNHDLYSEDLSDLGIAKLEGHLAKHHGEPFLVRMTVDAIVQAGHEKQAIENFNKLYQDVITQLSIDKSIRSIGLHVPDSLGK